MDKIIWAFFILLLGALALFLYLLWQYQMRSPRLSYTILPPYDVPDLIRVGGLMVENRGRAPAPNVRIDINYEQPDSGRIQHMHVVSEDAYILRGGGEQYNFATIRLRELHPHKRLFVYWAAGEQFKPRINVTSFQPVENQPLAKLRGAPGTLVASLRQRNKSE